MESPACSWREAVCVCVCVCVCVFMCMCVLGDLGACGDGPV